ncbi:hypothetical protein HZB88_04115, partial [archaeon]|nr:hypothetical protein [archaeon]
TPKQLFTRISIHDVIPDLFYDSKVFDKEAKQTVREHEAFSPADWDEKVSIGKYKLNQYHLEAVKRIYDRFNKNRQIKVSWKKFFEMLQKGEFRQYEKNIARFFDIIVSKKFMPNTPAIANFGNALGLGSACFVIGIEDSLESIMDALKNTAIVFKAGGGMGYNFSKLRPEGDFVSTTSGTASGPLSFMRLFDTMTEVIKQGGIRRGANMGILNSNHPDVLNFVTAKAGNKMLRNFNISVLIMPDFWEHMKENKPYPLLNPRNGQVVDHISPKLLWERIIYQAWESAEPGVIFYDTANKYNPFLKHLGPIVTTNPCVAAGPLISTENGLECIESIEAENIAIDKRTIEICSSGLSTLQLGCEFVKPCRKIKTGIKECYKITTRAGYELIATADHKVLTAEGWKAISELETGAEVLIQSGIGKFSTNKKLPFEVKNEIIGKNGRKYTLSLPGEWSNELGLLLGWLVGDGFINEKYSTLGFVFSKEDEEVRRIIQPLFEKYCNRKIKLVEYPNGCVQLRSNSKPIAEFFLKLGFNERKEVPSMLFTATEEAVIGFLQGLFSSDGTIGMGTKSRNYVRLNSSSERLLKGVQLLLLNLGIKSTIYNRSTKSKVFFYKDKKGTIKEYLTSGINFELNISKQNLERFVQKIEFLQVQNQAKYELLREFEYYHEHFTDSVKSV